MHICNDGLSVVFHDFISFDYSCLSQTYIPKSLLLILFKNKVFVVVKMLCVYVYSIK